VNSIALSPDDRYVAYGVANFSSTGSPYVYDERDEGWVGIVDLQGGAATQVRLPKFGWVRDVWWSPASDELFVIGDSLPIAPGDPLEGRQLHRLRLGDGALLHSVYESDIPGGISWAMPMGDRGGFLIDGRNGYYLLEGSALTPYEGGELLDTPDFKGRLVDRHPAPFQFAGEVACDS